MADMIDGQPVTDEMITKLAKEAEAGYPAEILRKRGRRPHGDSAGRVVTLRLDPQLLKAVQTRAKRDKTNSSEVIRDAVRAWL